MKRLLLFIVLFSCISTCIKAQYVRPENQQDTSKHARPASHSQDPWEHWSIGGNFSLSFGNVTYVVIAPLMNYHLTKSILLGAGPFYQYESVQDPVYGSYSSSIYGGRVAAIAFLPDPLSRIFLQAEYDFLNVPDPYTYVSNDARANIGIPLVGGGYKQAAGGNSYFTIAVLFDLSNSPLSPYYYGSNLYFPIFLAGFDIGL